MLSRLGRTSLARLRRPFGSAEAPPTRTATVSVTVLSDPRCPWCVVAHGRLHQALDILCAEDEAADSGATNVAVEVKWAPFFLDEGLTSKGVDRRSYYEAKFGTESMAMTSERMGAIFDDEGINAQLGNVGGGYSLDGVASNSLAAHRLLALAGVLDASSGPPSPVLFSANRNWAFTPSRQSDVAFELFRAYFGPARDNIADVDVLARVAANANIAPPLGSTDVRTFLRGDALTAQVVAAGVAAKSAGLGIPHVTIAAAGPSGAAAAVEVAGAAPAEELASALRRALAAALGSESSSSDSLGGESLGGEPASIPGRPVTSAAPSTGAGAWPGASAGDGVAASAWRWRSEDLWPDMLAAAGGALPSECPFDPNAHWSRLDDGSDGKAGIFGWSTCVVFCRPPSFTWG